MRQRLLRSTPFVLLGTGVLVWGWLRDPPPEGVESAAGVLQAAEPSGAPLPTAEELAKIAWEKRPAIDFLAAHRSALEKAGPPAAESEALGVPNDSAEVNRKVLSALGRQPASPGEVDWDASVNRFLLGEPATLNPVFMSSRYEQWLNELLFVLPINADRGFEHLGNLDVIERWETSADRLIDRIVLRGDLLWSDGKSVTAYDFEFAWRAILGEQVKSPSIRSLAEGLRAVKAYDERTIVYFQKEALATNHLHLAWSPLPRHILEPTFAADPTLRKSPEHVQFNAQPVTCGPYKLVKWSKGQELVLERHDRWHVDVAGKPIRARPYFREVRFKVFGDNETPFLAFQKGLIDEVQMTSDQWTSLASGAEFYKTNVKVRGDEWSYAFIGWCARSVPPNPFFADRRVRLAMSLALDHEFLLKDVFKGLYQPATGIFHPDSWMAAKGLRPHTQDLDRSEALLDEAGWTDADGDGVREKFVDGKRVPFELTLTCPSIGTSHKVAEQLQADLDKIGIRCKVKKLEWVAFQAAVKEHREQAFVYAMGTGTDPDTASNQWLTDAYQNGRNSTGYSNPRVDELFGLARREHERDKRAALYAEIDRLIYEDHPMTMLFYTPTLWGFSTSLRGYTHSPRGFANVLPGFHAWWKLKSPPAK